MSFFEGGWIDQIKTTFRGRPVVVTTAMEQLEGVYAIELEFTDGSTLNVKWDAAEREDVGSSFAVLRDGREWTPRNPGWQPVSRP